MFDDGDLAFAADTKGEFATFNPDNADPTKPTMYIGKLGMEMKGPSGDTVFKVDDTGDVEALDDKISGKSATITDLLPLEQREKREQRYQLTNSLGKETKFLPKDMAALTREDVWAGVDPKQIEYFEGTGFRGEEYNAWKEQHIKDMAKADQLRDEQQGVLTPMDWRGTCKPHKVNAPKCAWCLSHGGNKQEFIAYAMAKAVYIGFKEANAIFDEVCTPPAGGDSGGDAVPGNPGQCKPNRVNEDDCATCQTHGGAESSFVQEWIRQCNARGGTKCTELFAGNRFNAVCKTSGASPVAAPSVGR